MAGFGRHLVATWAQSMEILLGLGGWGFLEPRGSQDMGNLPNPTGVLHLHIVPSHLFCKVITGLIPGTLGAPELHQGVISEH